MGVVFTKRSEVHRIRLPRSLSCRDRDCRRREVKVGVSQLEINRYTVSGRLVVNRNIGSTKDSSPSNVRSGLIRNGTGIKSVHKVNY